MVKYMGLFRISTDNDIFFDDDTIKLIDKWDENEKFYNVYGWMDETGKLFLYNQYETINNGKLWMYLPNNIYWKMVDIYHSGNDKRVNKWFNNDCIDEQIVINENDFDFDCYKYYNLFYNENDLLNILPFTFNNWLRIVIGIEPEYYDNNYSNDDLYSEYENFPRSEWNKYCIDYLYNNEMGVN